MPAIKTKLQPGSKGKMVKPLQKELDVLGSGLDKGGVKSGTFGDTTKATVLEFQTQFGMEPTGIVDQATGTLPKAAARFTTGDNTKEMRQELADNLQANPKKHMLDPGFQHDAVPLNLLRPIC